MKVFGKVEGEVEKLVERVAHEKDLSTATVGHLPGSVVSVNSNDFPCKSDCLRCKLEAALRSDAEKGGAIMWDNNPPKRESGEHRADSDRTSAQPYHCTYCDGDHNEKDCPQRCVPRAASAGALSAEALLDLILNLSEDIDCELWGPEGSKEINARGRIVPLISAFADKLLAFHDQTAITKLWYVAKHLNISDPPQPTDLLTAVALVEHAAEWARMHIEKRGKENDELREQVAAHDQKVREQVAGWMIKNSFATGHGDTLEDLLKELSWQLAERDAKVLEEAAKVIDKEIADHEKFDEHLSSLDELAAAIRALASPAEEK